MNINRIILGDKYYLNSDDLKHYKKDSLTTTNNRHGYELYLIINDYVPTGPEYTDAIIYIYNVVTKYINSSRKENFKPKAIKYFNNIFDVNKSNTSSGDRLCFVAMHITFLFIRVLSTS